MKIYCLEDFKVEFEKLISKKPYRDLQKEFIAYFFDKRFDDLKSGTRLNNSDEVPYIKKRLNGSGGYRCYFLLIVKEEDLYLLFIHPKTGPLGSSNITDESKAYLYKKAHNSIQNSDLYELTLNTSKSRIIFTKCLSTD